MTFARERDPAHCRPGLATFGLALALAAALPSLPAAAQSFDCTRARTPEEKAICADPLLSLLDEIMADFYRRLRDYTERFDNAMGLQAQLVGEARAFLKERARCGRKRTCLEKVYRARIRQLLTWWQKAMDETGGSDAASPAASGTANSSTPDEKAATLSTTGDICKAIGFERFPEMTKLCPDLAAYAEYIETWPLTRGFVACALPCEAGAYNVRYRILFLDPKTPDNAMFISFGTVGPNGEDRLMDEIVNPEYDPKTRTLRAFDRARGLGDCGMKWTWRWAGGVFELTEQRQKTRCDGRPGPWKRIFPPSGRSLQRR